MSRTVCSVSDSPLLPPIIVISGPRGAVPELEPVLDPGPLCEVCVPPLP